MSGIKEETMEQFRDYLEILYFLSGPVLVVIAYIALAQIKLAKNQIEVQRNANRVSAKRDALRLTSEQIKDQKLLLVMTTSRSSLAVMMQK